MTNLSRKTEDEHPAPTSTSAADAATVAMSTEAAPEKKGISTKTYRCKLEFSGPPTEVFSCLTDKGRLSVFSQSEAQITLKEGEPFSLFHGSITGTIEKIVPGERLVQKWRFTSWPEGHYSTVDFRFEPSNSGTLLKMKHASIPADDLDRTCAGWRSNFWERIRMVFGFNFKEL